MCCRGTRPSQAEKSRPRRKLSIGGAKACSAIAVTGPIPRDSQPCGDQVCDRPPLPTDQLFHDGRSLDFDVVATGFIHEYTPIEFAENRSDPDPKRGAVDYGAKLWIVTGHHCVRDTPVVAVRIRTADGTRVYATRASTWWMHPDEDVAVTPFGLDNDADLVTDEAAAEALQALVVSSASEKGTATRGQIKQRVLGSPRPRP